MSSGIVEDGGRVVESWVTSDSVDEFGDVDVVPGAYVLRSLDWLKL